MAGAAHPSTMNQSSAPSTEGGQPDTSPAPLVSVIMPAYNTSTYIRESIDSVLEQDYPHKELIVIDDGSTDGTLDILRSYGDRLILLTQQNQGSAVARNAGLDAARGEYVAFIDSDDVWLPGKLTTQVRYLKHNPHVGLAYSRWHKWRPNPDGTFPPSSSFTPDAGDLKEWEPQITRDGSGWLYTELLFVSKLHTITVVARRSLIDTVGRFDASLKRGQDYDYWLRASRVTQIHQLDQPLALYRLHDDGCISKYPNVNYEHLVVQKALDAWGTTGPDGSTTTRSAIRRRLSETCFNFGYYHYWEGTPRLAALGFAQSALQQPLQRGAWMYLLMSSIKWMRALASRRHS